MKNKAIPTRMFVTNTIKTTKSITVPILMINHCPRCEPSDKMTTILTGFKLYLSMVLLSLSKERVTFDITSVKKHL